MKAVITKEQLENPCKGCNKNESYCCTYVTIDIPKYKNEIDIDRIHWFLTRKDFRVVCNLVKGKPTLKPKNWDIFLMSKCVFLGDKGLCTNYENRPLICSSYTAFPTKEQDGFCHRYFQSDDKKCTEIQFTDSEKFLEFVKKHFRWNVASRRGKNAKYIKDYLEVIEV